LDFSLILSETSKTYDIIVSVKGKDPILSSGIQSISRDIDVSKLMDIWS